MCVSNAFRRSSSAKRIDWSSLFLSGLNSAWAGGRIRTHRGGWSSGILERDRIGIVPRSPSHEASGQASLRCVRSRIQLDDRPGRERFDGDQSDTFRRCCRQEFGIISARVNKVVRKHDVIEPFEFVQGTIIRRSSCLETPMERTFPACLAFRRTSQSVIPATR
jgi:hypothetical protein